MESRSNWKSMIVILTSWRSGRLHVTLKEVLSRDDLGEESMRPDSHSSVMSRSRRKLVLASLNRVAHPFPTTGHANCDKGRQG